MVINGLRRFKSLKEKFIRYNPFYILNCFTRRLFSESKLPEQEVIIIRLDLIGDCAMFSGALRQIKKKYKDYKISIICLKSTRCIFERVGGINKIYTYNLSPTNLSYKEISRLLKEIGTKKFSVLLQPQTSRPKAADVLSYWVTSNYKVAIECKFDNSTEEWKKKAERFYSKIIPIPFGWRNEFEYYLAFLHGLDIQAEINQIQPFLYFSVQNEVKCKYFIISPGASFLQRAWEPKKYALVSDYIYKQTGWIPVIIGTGNEANLAEEITQESCPSSRFNIQNKVGKTSVSEMIDLIANAEIVLCNDSSSAHIASSVGKTSIAITGGGHLNRFLPYPETFDCTPLVISETIGCEFCSWNPAIIRKNKICFQRGFLQGKNFLCICKISEKRVIQLLEEKLPLILNSYEN